MINIKANVAIDQFNSIFSELFLSHDDMEKLHDFEEECAEDYFREKEIQLQSSSDKRIQVINERCVCHSTEMSRDI